MNVFISGATGVVGRRVVPLLVRRGHRVTALVRSAEKRALLARSGARPVVADLLDRGVLGRVVPGHDVVINLSTHIPHSMLRMLLPGAWRENDRIRRVGSANLVDAAIASGLQRYMQESFALVYPDRGDAWIDEDTPLHPAPYNRTVADAEHSAQRFMQAGRAGIVLRFAGFYGPDAFQARAFVSSVRRGWAPLPGAAGAYASSVSHDDAASAVIAALQAPTGVYNVTDDEPLTRREYGDMLAELLGVPPPKSLPAWVTRVLGSSGELFARSQRISNRRLKRATGWTPSYPTAREGWRDLLRAANERARGAAVQP
jgi:nucleoside-diphosphate-sugar epimerase